MAKELATVADLDALQKGVDLLASEIRDRLAGQGSRLVRVEAGERELVRRVTEAEERLIDVKENLGARIDSLRADMEEQVKDLQESRTAIVSEVRDGARELDDRLNAIDESIEAILARSRYHLDASKVQEARIEALERWIASHDREESSRLNAKMFPSSVAGTANRFTKLGQLATEGSYATEVNPNLTAAPSRTATENLSTAGVAAIAHANRERRECFARFPVGTPVRQRGTERRFLVVDYYGDRQMGLRPLEGGTDWVLRVDELVRQVMRDA